MKKILLLILMSHVIFAQTVNKKIEEHLAFEKYDQVITDVDNALLTETNRKQIASLKYFKAKALYHQGELEDAFNILKELVEDYNFDIDYEKVLNLQFEISNARYEKSGNSNFFGSSAEAIQFYEDLIAQAPYSKGAATSMLRIGMLQQDDDDEIAAMSTYHKLIATYPKSDEAGYARIYIAQFNIRSMRGIYGDLELMREARTQLRLFINQYNKHPLLTEAKDQIKSLDEVEAERTFNLALFYLDPVHSRPAAAKRYLYRVIVDFPDTEAAIAAEEKLAKIDSNYKGELKTKQISRKKNTALQKTLEQQIFSPLAPQAKDRSTRRTIVRPEDSNGKYLVPVEDLGLDLVPLENTDTTKKKDDK
ncbi:tetratricopeptide repeat protein [Lentisphaera profundi]|uniref:Tetratricopeptide repeat protein n=1 Tax=Lentisphaera profundi TaxID=1658616 RepID=A0ABY7VQ42_9BACT|nr:outer membrane protein assembly factor BamD [Lentisphaera profundi]WDE95429.1 tetratricopeptide repeat protein [Lentisphaera profundi]